MYTHSFLVLASWYLENFSPMDYSNHWFPIIGSSGSKIISRSTIRRPVIGTFLLSHAAIFLFFSRNMEIAIQTKTVGLVLFAVKTIVSANLVGLEDSGINGMTAVLVDAVQHIHVLLEMVFVKLILIVSIQTLICVRQMWGAMIISILTKQNFQIIQ